MRREATDEDGRRGAVRLPNARLLNKPLLTPNAVAARLGMTLAEFRRSEAYYELPWYGFRGLPENIIRLRPDDLDAYLAGDRQAVAAYRLDLDKAEREAVHQSFAAQCSAVDASYPPKATRYQNECVDQAIVILADDYPHERYWFVREYPKLRLARARKYVRPDIAIIERGTLRWAACVEVGNLTYETKLLDLERAVTPTRVIWLPKTDLHGGELNRFRLPQFRRGDA
jgi:hypothetical protein